MLTTRTRRSPSAEEQGLLFTDDVSPLPSDTGYRGPTACNAAGITYRQLDYWARTWFNEPSVRGAKAWVPAPLLLPRDILILKVIKRLLDAGISLQQIRTAVMFLRERGTDDLTRVTLMSVMASSAPRAPAPSTRSSTCSRAARESSALPSWSGERSRGRSPSCPPSAPRRRVAEADLADELARRRAARQIS
ncbi:MAG: MerR family transcriptional regulator [Nocardioidaceae bacterium]